MSSNIFLKYITRRAIDDVKMFVSRMRQNRLLPPTYNALRYSQDVAEHEYFAALEVIRHYLKLTSDAYWIELGAKNVDLFMLTPSASSPMGPGSDSEVIGVQFGKFHTNLTDSSQFGLEPLMFHFDRLYCYLPSMRGENPDHRHLNQFFHCEVEIVGILEELLPLVEGYVRSLSKTMLTLAPLIKLMSVDFEKTSIALSSIVASGSFQKIPFNDAFLWLHQNTSFYKTSAFGRNITSVGEIELTQRNNNVLPLWLCNFDRNIVPFYQKPNPANVNAVINADLLFPPIVKNGLGGEIVGAGQRQDSPKEIKESLRRQHIVLGPYEWYINLRKHPRYKTTSGFGLGIERFIAWSLGYSDIKDVILYPRLKNVYSLP